MRFSKPQLFFCQASLFFGFIYIFLVPPFHVPDEPDHFKRAYHISEGGLSGEQYMDRLGGKLPTSILNLARLYRPIRFNYSEKVSDSLFQNAISITLKNKERSFADFPNTGLYPPTVYFPQILTLILLKPFQIRPLFLLYICRIATFLFWVFMVLYSIKLIPTKKWLWTLLALLPASLFINASASGDVVTNAVSFVFIALFLRLILDEKAKVTKKIIFQLVLFSTILSLNKFVYAPISLLVFLIPKHKMSQKKKLALIFWNVVVVLFWYLHSKSLFISYDNYNVAFRNGITLNEGVNPLEQLQFIFQNPFLFIKTFVLSYVDTLPATSAHYFGKFGWEKNYIPNVLIGILTLLTIIFSFNKSQNQIYWTNKERAIMLFIPLIMTIGLSITIYMMWIKVGGELIHSLSGRYFIPILPLVWLALPPLISVKEERLQFIMKLIILLSLSSGVICAYLRYY